MSESNNSICVVSTPPNRWDYKHITISFLVLYLHIHTVRSLILLPPFTSFKKWVIFPADFSSPSFQTCENPVKIASTNPNISKKYIFFEAVCQSSYYKGEKRLNRFYL
ncbi:hypothetical protein ILYODFUR_023806 [Ilyodon furcidens]|uniref:Uncharacterized protein n=1 Tax=Ilyodon furcidens TaxID=33524 RepID=A0ABV0UBS3_9TELE